MIIAGIIVGLLDAIAVISFVVVYNKAKRGEFND